MGDDRRMMKKKQKKKGRKKKEKKKSDEIQYRLRITHVNEKYPDLINTSRHQFWNGCDCDLRPAIYDYDILLYTMRDIN